MLAVVLLASLGTSLNELARTLPQYRNYLYEPMQTIAPWLQRLVLPSRWWSLTNTSTPTP